MQPDPPPIPTPVPKRDPPTLRKPLRLALLRAAGFVLRRAPHAPSAGLSSSAVRPAEHSGDATRRSVPRILLIRPDHLGDMLFLTPALRVLRERMPGAHLTALIGPWAKPVLARNPHLDNIRTLDFPGFTRTAKGSPLAPYRLLWASARELRAQGYDTAVVLRFDHWWGALLAALAGIPRRIGYTVPEVQPFLTEALPYERGRHEVLQNIRLAMWAACPPATTQERVAEPSPATPAALPLEFDPGPEAAAFVDAWLRAKGIGAGGQGTSGAGAGYGEPGTAHPRQERGAGGQVAGDVGPSPLGSSQSPASPAGPNGPAGTQFALLVPGSGAAVKLWREDGFARVTEALAARGLKVIVVGAGEAERELARRIAAQSRAPLIDAVGETTFEQLAALSARAVLVVGADSGPMHLAIAVRTPTVHLFGPVSAQTFGPWGEPGRHIVLTSGLACIACNRLDYLPGELAAHPCVPLIADRQVLAAIEALCAML